jgi:rhodanese-related sulfurtransferase
VNRWQTVAAGAALALAVARSGGADATTPPGRIAMDEFKKALDDKSVVVLDVRSAEQYAAGHIPGSLSRPLSTVDSWASEFKESRKPIVTYCA